MNFFYPWVSALSICGVMYCSAVAIVQVDLKKLIAYLSVAHMNLVVLGIFSLNLQGIQGSLFLMIAHGLVSNGLFFWWVFCTIGTTPGQSCIILDY